MSNQYRPIDHPAVAAVQCPVCGEPKGAPCKLVSPPRFDPKPLQRRYVQTHMKRVRLFLRQQVKAGGMKPA